MLYDKPKIFFTADLHIGHRNIIKYCNRPFANEDEMTSTLVKNWNSVVSKNDNIYVLGDFSFAGPRIEPIFKQLNGNKFLIKGNHDDKHCTRLQWVWVKDIHDLNYKSKSFVLCHYPLLSWNKSFHKSIDCHGHIHSKNLQNNKDILRFDVGVDANNYTPINIETIINIASFFHTSEEVPIQTL